LKQFDRLIVLTDQLDQQYYRVNVRVKEVSMRKKRQLEFFLRGNDLLEDNQVKSQPFEDDLMHKLIQMEENIFQH